MKTVDLQRYTGSEPPAEEVIAEQLRGEADRSHRWSNGPGAQYGVHSHSYRKILYVAEGSITFTPTGQSPVKMQPGDRIDIPAGTPHGAVVGSDGVVCWEGVSRSQAAHAESVRDA